MAEPHSDDVVDYDAHGYDYRGYWQDREYEQWAEAHALGRSVRRLGRSDWFADFGGAFGRNAVHYLDRTDHAVILDYSATNLANAARRYPDQVASGKLHLIRCDLNAIPFRDHTFDAALLVRVLHHLSDLPTGLAEMGRTVAGRWLIDVPIKHHVAAVVRSARPGRWTEVNDAAPVLVGQAEPYWNFQLGAVRDQLRGLGWRPGLVASVNNLRRYDRVLPTGVERTVRPLAYGLELALQRVGRGWWGPSQLLLAQRYDPARAYQPAGPDRFGLPAELAPLAARMACPTCLRGLLWTEQEATCSWCDRTFARRDAFWDFVAEARPARPSRLNAGAPYNRFLLNRVPLQPPGGGDGGGVAGWPGGGQGGGGGSNGVRRVPPRRGRGAAARAGTGRRRGAPRVAQPR